MGECSDNVELMAQMSEQLTHLDRMMRRPIWLDPTTGSLKVVYPSAQPVTISSGTVTTVTTVTGQTNKGGMAILDTEMRYLMKNKWQSAVRSRIS